MIGWEVGDVRRNEGWRSIGSEGGVGVLGEGK